MVACVALVGVVVLAAGVPPVGPVGAAPGGTGATSGAGAPTVDPAPEVEIATMATSGGQHGIEISENNLTPLPNCPSDVRRNVASTACFYPDTHPGAWVQLVVLNRSTLALVQNTDMECPMASDTPTEAVFTQGGHPCMSQLSTFVGGLTSNELVIASNQPGNDPHLQPPVGLDAVLAGVAGYKGIGATPNWYDARVGSAPITPVRGSFSAVGVPGSARGSGTSNAAAKFDEAGSGALQALWALTNNGQYAPFKLTVPALAAERAPLLGVLARGLSDWPEAAEGAADPAEALRRAEAFSAVGNQIGLGTDPRAQYYSEPLDFNWEGRLFALKYEDFYDLRPRPTDFMEPDYDWAKEELETEIRDVIDVTSYLKTLAAPYPGASSTFWSTFGRVQAQVDASMVNESTVMAKATASAVIEGVLRLGSALPPPVGFVFTATGLLYQAALVVGRYLENSAGSDFQTQASQLAVDLTRRLDAAENEIEIRWRNIIVSDYQKLDTVALCSTSRPKCKDDSPGWSVSAQAAKSAEQGLKIGLETELYASLVPARYPTLINLGVQPQTVIDDPALYCRPLAPFSSQSAVPSLPASFPDRTMFVVATQPVLNEPFHTLNKDVLKKMFGKIDPAQPGQGGFGLNEDQYFFENYIRPAKHKAPIEIPQLSRCKT
jgi:hypothetical protein